MRTLNKDKVTELLESDHDSGYKHIGLLKQFNSKLFNPKSPKPLAIGIDKQMFELIGDVVSKKRVRKAIHFWVNRFAYKKALVAGAHRYDLKMKPQGEVSEEIAKQAKKELKKIHRDLALSKMKKSKQQTSGLVS